MPELLQAALINGGGFPGTDESLSGYVQPVCFGGNNTSGSIDVSPALNANRGCHNPGDFESGMLIAKTLLSGGHANNPIDENLIPVCITGNVTHALKAEGFDGSEDGTGRGQPIVAFPGRLSGTQYASMQDVSPSLSAIKPMAIASSMQVRRLTPRECERLQGFPDDYTLIPVRGKAAADGPRYKALGNSMAVPVMRWIGRKLKTALVEAERSA